jgi:YgiT-type zinc finger domain-containing protein
MRDKPPNVSDVERPYPRRCFACGKDTVSQTRIPYDAKVRHDGKHHAFHIPSLQIDQCNHCGEQYFTAVTDDQIRVGLRKHLGLLTVDEIRAGLEKYGVGQKVFAEHLGIAAETVSRWFNDGAAQTRSLDKLMRLYFSIPAVRAVLANPELKEQGSGVPDLAM